MVRNILLLGNPLLRVRCAKVHSFGSSTLTSLITDLRDTLLDFKRRNGFGRGIAAPQIGVTQRVIFTHVDKPITLINPRIIKRSKSVFSLWDDCFSFPHLLVKVIRNQNIVVHYQDEMGMRQTLKAEGGLSELLQHEIDHLNGVLAIDRAIDSKHIVFKSELSKIEKTDVTSVM